MHKSLRKEIKKNPGSLNDIFWILIQLIHFFDFVISSFGRFLIIHAIIVDKGPFSK
jgi:hypothetical protein